jgi:hypothetical protein
MDGTNAPDGKLLSSFCTPVTHQQQLATMEPATVVQHSALLAVI